MGMETAATKAVSDSAKVATKGAEKLVKKLWSIMDAASEKKPPGEFLSSRAISSIQGKHPH